MTVTAIGDGRDRQGRFAPGNAGGPGRARRATERAYLAALQEACPPQTWQRIIERAVSDATEGDAKAREWLAGYLVGKPDAVAASLHRLAVQEELGTDPVAEDIEAGLREQERQESHREQEARLRARGLRPGSNEWLLAELAEDI